jgi:phage shock protein PspC (stress-responsive transcriptional regulator)
MERRLYRSRGDRVIWGVCGGLARYLNVDVTVIRLVMILLVFANGIGILIYLVMTLIVPLEGSKSAQPRETMRENVEEMKKTAGELREEIRSTFGEKEAEVEDRSENPGRTRHWVGIALIVAGLLFLMANLGFFWWFDWDAMWPLILVAIGLVLILNVGRRRHD